MLQDRKSYTIAEIVEGGGFGRPLLLILALCFLLMVCDSYDVAALSFAAPVLIKQWGITPAAMGVVFSTGLFGLLVGSILFGWVGDRFGRKRAMIIGALCFSVLTAATGLVGSQAELLVLRFVATIGLGGAVPNAVALVTEFTPRARRMMAVGIIFAGYSVGGIFAGLTATYVIGVLGWPMMFYIGGGLSLATTMAFLLLPESLSFLATIPARQAEALRVAAFLRPGMPFPAGSRVLPDVGVDAAHSRLADLFAGRLRIATPVMWLIYIANSITVFSLSSWMPVAVESVGFPRAMAATATAVLFAGSAVGGYPGWAFCRPEGPDRHHRPGGPCLSHRRSTRCARRQRPVAVPGQLSGWLLCLRRPDLPAWLRRLALSHEPSRQRRRLGNRHREDRLHGRPTHRRAAVAAVAR